MKRPVNASKALFVAVFLFLLISGPLPAGRAYEVEEGDVILHQGEYWNCSIDLSYSGGLTYEIDVKDGGPLHLELMDYYNYQEYASGGEHTAIREDDVEKSASISLSLLPDHYVLVVENAGNGNVSFHYRVTYGYDYSPSIWDSVLSGLSTAMCISLTLFEMIWVVAAVWTYRDAGRHGKKGLPWAILVLLLPVFGLVIWYMVRQSSRNDRDGP